jgi:hypothetical protein
MNKRGPGEAVLRGGLSGEEAAAQQSTPSPGILCPVGEPAAATLVAPQHPIQGQPRAAQVVNAGVALRQVDIPYAAPARVHRGSKIALTNTAVNNTPAPSNSENMVSSSSAPRARPRQITTTMERFTP